ncbi:MAG TPA: DUF4214 domain-containing protein [Iamia sp.]|nr:DUF4214 domain-containing protein [Iamia sp.]
MARRARFTGGALGLVVVIASVAGTASPAAAAPAVQLTSAGPPGPLLDQHDVQVLATGLVAGDTYRIAACFGATVATCAEPDDDWQTDGHFPPKIQTEVVADVSGEAGGRLLLPRSLPIDGSAHDCTGTTCRVAVIDEADAMVAFTPLTFAATGHYQWPDATLELTPTTGLLDGTEVFVQAAGLDPWFGADEPWAEIEICHDDDCLPGIVFHPILGWTRFDVAPIALDGTTSTSFFMRRRIKVGGSTVDCAQVGCTIAVSQHQYQGVGEIEPRTNEVPVSFAPEWHPWPTVDRFIAEGVESVRGAPLGTSARATLVNGLTARTTLGPDALAAASANAPNDATVGEVTRLYKAFFARAVETGGLGYWVGRLQAGATVTSIGRAFGGTAEFRARDDAMTDTQAVEALYLATLGRMPGSAGRDYWVDQLGRGMARPTMVLHFSRSAEFRLRETNRVRATLLTWGLLARAPTASERGRTPANLVPLLLASGALPRP